MFIMPDHKWARLLANVTGMVNQQSLRQRKAGQFPIPLRRTPLPQEILRRDVF